MRQCRFDRSYHLLIILLASVWPSASYATVVSITQFEVVRDGVLYFRDTYSDNLEPPSAPNFSGTQIPATYTVSGTIPNTAEANGVLQLDSANGVLSASATNELRSTLVMRLNTNISSSTPTLGLRDDYTLDFTGIFSLATPSVPGSNYGIRFTDNSGSGPHQTIQLQVDRSATTGLMEVRFLLQDFDLHTITTLGSAAFAPPQGADLIGLEITRPNLGNNEFFGSFGYFGSGAFIPGSLTQFSTPALGFQGEDFVRAEVVVSEPIPEPATLALLTLGLAGFGFSRRKRT